MATALTETVLQYIPTFEKVETLNHTIQSSSIPQSPDGAGTDEPLQHSLVLTNVTTKPSPTEHKMQKKIDYEIGKVKPKSSRRLLRTISKSVLRATSNSKEQPSSPKLNRQLKQSTRTISQHEINYMKKSTNNVKNPNLKASTTLKASNNLKASTNLKGSVNLKKSTNVRSKPTTLTMTIELSKPVEVAKVEPVQKPMTDLKLSRGNSQRAMAPRVPSSNALQSPAMSSRGPILSNSPLRSSANRTQSPAVSTRPAVPARKQSFVQEASSASPAMRSPRAIPRASSGLRMSSSLKQSAGIRPVPVGTSNEDTLKVLLHDFETQHRRAVKIGAVEQEIYKQEISKFQEMMEKKQQDHDNAMELSKNIQEREDRLVTLFKDLERKKRAYKGTEEELAAAVKEFEAEVQQQQEQIQLPQEVCAVAGGSTAAARMQEASNRKQLREQWRMNAHNSTVDTRHRLLQQQQEIRETEAKINVLKKELGRMKNTAGKSKSSDHRLREEIVLRENMRKTGQPKERGQWQRPKGAPKNNEKPAVLSRLEEEKAKRRASNRATVNVSDLITAQAGVSRSRYGTSSPYRNTVAGTLRGGVQIN